MIFNMACLKGLRNCIFNHAYNKNFNLIKNNSLDIEILNIFTVF